MTSPLLKLFRQPTLLASFAFAGSGGAFAVGNLLLARTLNVPAFGQFALIVAVYNILTSFAPLGADQLAIRTAVRPNLAMVITIVSAALIMTGCASLTFPGGISFTPGLMSLVMVSTAAGSVVSTVAAYCRADGLFKAGLFYSTAASWIIVAIGCLAVMYGTTEIGWPVLLFAAGNVAVAIIGCGFSLRWSASRRTSTWRQHWREGVALLGIVGVGAIALQIERLIIPVALDLRQLAVFGVLASVAIFPFRLFIAGAGFTLTPRLQAVRCRSQRRSLIIAEIQLAVPILVTVSGAIVAIVPYAVPYLTRGAYSVGTGLAAAACMSGTVKFIQSFARAVIMGVGSVRDIANLKSNGAVWLILTVIGGVLGARYALTGLLVGASAAGAVALLPTILLAFGTLRASD